MREAQRNTLITLLDQVSPGGQIPSNVRIDSGTPDYSGVGRIASIDSGLWVIIALYNFVQATGELDLVRNYAGTLQRAMTWLSAQDSNNDGLLEIPEAGDWTDLFGHSYNVLCTMRPCGIERTFATASCSRCKGSSFGLPNTSAPGNARAAKFSPTSGRRRA